MTTDETIPGQLDAGGQRRRSSVRWDPTINLGHVLTFISAMVASLSAVVLAWSDLRSKDVVHDQRLQSIESKALYEEARSRETLREMRDDIREVRRGIESIQRSNNGRSTQP